MVRPILVATFCGIMPHGAFAQGANADGAAASAPADPSGAATISEDESSQAPAVSVDAVRAALDVKINDIVERYIPKNKFNIQLEISLTEQVTSQAALPYLPGPSAPLVQQMTLDELLPLVARIRIVLEITGYKDTVDTFLRNLLANRLRLNPTRGDSVTIQRIALELEVNESVVERELSGKVRETQDALTLERQKSQNLETRMQTLQDERNRLQTEAQTAARKVDDLGRDVKTAEKSLDDTTAKLRVVEQKASVVEDKKGRFGLDDDLKFVAEHGVTVLVAILGIISLLFGMRSLTSSARIVGSGISRVGDAIQRVGGDLAQAESVGPQRDRGSAGEARGSGDGAVVAAGRSGPVEDLHKRIVALHSELNSHLTPATEPALVEHLSRLLQSPTSVPFAVLGMEIFGRERANSLFRKLGTSARQEVLEFLRDGKYDRPKAEMMLEIGEDLVTRLLAGEFAMLSGRSHEVVMSTLSELDAGDVAELAKTIPDGLMPRLFVYLNPQSLGTLLTKLGQEDEVRFRLAVEALGKVPVYAERQDLDDQLAAALQGHVKKVREDVQRPYLRFYQGILEKLDDSLGGRAVEILSELGPNVAKYLAQNVITFDAAFLLPDTAMEGLFDGLTNRELAAVLTFAPEAAAQRLVASLGQQRMTLVQDDVESFRAMSESLRKRTFERVRGKVVERLRGILKSGEVELATPANAANANAA